MKKYKTVSGDMWDSIAKKELGGERYTHILIRANTGYINTTVFKAGVELNIPEISLPTPSLLPPWKRG